MRFLFQKNFYLADLGAACVPLLTVDLQLKMRIHFEHQINIVYVFQYIYETDMYSTVNWGDLGTGVTWDINLDPHISVKNEDSGFKDQLKVLFKTVFQEVFV